MKNFTTVLLRYTYIVEILEYIIYIVVRCIFEYSSSLKVTLVKHLSTHSQPFGRDKSVVSVLSSIEMGEDV